MPGFVYHRSIDGVKLSEDVSAPAVEIERTKVDGVQLSEEAATPLHRQFVDSMHLRDRVESDAPNDRDSMRTRETAELSMTRTIVIGGTNEEVTIRVSRNVAIIQLPAITPISYVFEEALKFAESVVLEVGGDVIPILTSDPTDPSITTWYLLTPFVPPTVALSAVVRGKKVAPIPDFTSFSGSVESISSPGTPLMTLAGTAITVGDRPFFAANWGLSLGDIGLEYNIVFGFKPGLGTATVTPAATEGLIAEYGETHTVADIVSALNTWSLANLSTPQSIAAAIVPGALASDLDGVALELSPGLGFDSGRLTNLWTSQEPKFQVDLSLPLTVSDLYEFNNSSGNVAFEGFNVCAHASLGTGRPATGVRIDPVSAGYGMVVRCSDTATVQDAVDAINAYAAANMAQTSIATHLGSDGSQLASAAWPTLPVRPTLPGDSIGAVGDGEFGAFYSFFLDFDGSRETLELRARTPNEVLFVRGMDTFVNAPFIL